MPTPRLLSFVFLFLIGLIAIPAAAQESIVPLYAGLLHHNTQPDTNGIDLSDVVVCGGSPPPSIYAGFTVAALPSIPLNIDDLSAFRTFAVHNSESTMKTGWSVGLQGEYLIGNPRDTRSSFLAGVSVISLPAFLTGNEQVPLEFGNSAASLSDALYERQISLSILNIDLLYRYLIGRSRFSVQVGTSVGVVVDGVESETVSLIHPEARFVQSEHATRQGITFGDDMRTAVLAEHDIGNINRMRVALLAGLSYDIPLRKWMVVPYVHYNFPLTSLQSGMDLKISALQAGVQVRYALGVF